MDINSLQLIRNLQLYMYYIKCSNFSVFQKWTVAFELGKIIEVLVKWEKLVLLFIHVWINYTVN